MNILKLLIFSCLLINTVYAKQTFKEWKFSYAKRASKRGIPQKFALNLLSGVTVDNEIIKKDRKQVVSDKTIDYHKFIKKWLRENPSRIEQGKHELKKNYALLEKIEKKYNVEKEIIVALWGVETFYGKITGDYDLIRSLATLAYRGRRKKFFEIQLNAAFRLIKQGHITREKLKGSWAGATGQCQFMPSNINIYAQDFNKDGKKDIWETKADIFASIAYFLKRVGWKKGKSIGTLVYHNKKATQIPMKNAPAIIKGSNYKQILYWNKSSLFAAFNIILINGFNSR